MTVKNAAVDVLAAVEVLQHARVACSNLRPLGYPLSEQELEQRARIIDTVIRTRRLLKQLQTRTDDLGDAGVRFEQRREAISA
jgi:hypothetical protein